MKQQELQKVREAFGMTEYKLGNGLRVLHRYDDSAPIVALMVTYHVGSRNEAVGHTGSTHILEHLLFKDSKNFNKANGKSPTGYLEELGAQMNATTWLDRTNYFELLPSSEISEAIALEADRMRYSLFSAEDLATEMTVVRNEFERGRNRPEELLEEAVWATAFMAHPYHHPTIGWKEDIENSSAEKLRDFYNRFYYPNNATVTLIGDLKKEEMRALVLKHFAPLPPSKEAIPGVHTKEYEQEGLRTVEVEGQGEMELALVAQKMPAGSDPKYAAFLVLAQVLAGGLASRLDDALVDQGKAVYVHPFMHAMHDPSLFTLVAQATPGVKATDLVERISFELNKVQKSGITASELARAKEQILAQSAYERDGILSEAWAVSEAIAAGDWQLTYTKEAAVLAVTLADVKKIAAETMSKKTRTVGLLSPRRT